MKQNIVNKINPDEDFQQIITSNKYNLFDIIRGILNQIGQSNMRIATFSNSEEFLRRLYIQKQKGLIAHLELITDNKAAKKTLKLSYFIRKVYDEVFFANNHSKVVLFDNEQHHLAVLTSQNQTRGSRFEVHVISNNPLFFHDLECGFEQVKNKSRNVNGLLDRHIERNRKLCASTNSD